MNLIRLAIARPIGTLMLCGMVLLIGLVSLFSLPIELLPELSFPRLSVRTDLPGAGPEEVENLVTRPIEETVSAAVGARDVTSSSSEGSSSVTITFPSGTDLDAAASDVRAAIERARRRLPASASNPIVFKFDPSQQPIVQLGLVAQGADLGLSELRQLAEDQLQFRLERVPGVAQVNISGGLRRQIQVYLDPVRMQGLGISERDVLAALAGSNLIVPGGQVTEGTRRLGLRVSSQYRTVDQVAQTVVITRGGVALTVGDVASVDEREEERTSLVRINGRPGVLISILRQSGANTVAVADGVIKAAQAVALPGAEVIVLGDNARFIRRSISSVEQALMIGGVLAAGVLVLFLRDIRSILIVATAVPLSMIATFAMMYFFNYTLNLMTLGGLALGIGMMVDGAIVVVENVFRHRERGQSGIGAATAGTEQVASAVIASQLTTVVVFLPVVLMRGSVITTQLFFQFSVVVTFALLCSLVVALTLVPTLAARLPRLAHPERGWTVRLQRSYRGVLGWALSHRRVVFAAALVVFVLGMGSYVLLGRQTLPTADEGEIFVSLTLPTGTRLELTTQAMDGLERTVREAVPEAEVITTTAGGAVFGPSGSHRGSLRIRLVPKGQRARGTEEIATALRRGLQVSGGRIFVRASEGALSVLRFGATDPVEVEVRGFDLQRGLEVAQQVRETLEAIPGITDASVSREERLPEVVVRIDSRRAAGLGVTPAQISAAIRTAVAGDVATTLRAGGRETDIVVRQREGADLAPSDVLSLPVITTGGRQIRLSQVVEMVRTDAPTSIFRRSRQRVIEVTAGISGRDYGSVMNDVRSRLAGLALPEGFSVALGTAYEEEQAAYRQLSIGFLVAVLLVYAVMAIQFEALAAPLLIMGSVPFALAGALLTLFLTNTILSIQSVIGLIVLAGVVVNNAIVLLTFIQDMRRDGMSLRQAAVEGSAARLRPVLMTTLTTVMGLLPIAIGIGEGAELQAPMARAVVGGLTLGTLVTLVFIPTLYVAVEEFRTRRERVPAHERGLMEPALHSGGASGSGPAPVAGGGNGESAD
ncbi:MAG TPA: efflux RND transporter permease subunit [bacterium]|nr:efflux RND transporter permease subunit [bacterium]